MSVVSSGGGARANRKGAKLEQLVAFDLDSYGYFELGTTPKKRKEILDLIKAGVDPVDVLKDEALDWAEDGVFMQQVTGYPTVYGQPHKHDMLVYHAKHFPNGLIIEVKQQAVSGSADEKLVFTVNSLKNMPPDKLVLVLSGGGTRPCAVQWMQAQQDSRFEVMLGHGAFTRWIRSRPA